MANPPTYPSDGRITSLQNYTASLVGTELLPLVAPGNASNGINYNVTVTQMLTGLLPALPPQSPNVVLAGPAAGPATATPTFRSLVLADVPAGTTSFPLVGNGVSTAPSYQALNLSSTFVTSFLSVVNGGIGTTGLPLDGVVLGNATALTVVSATTANYPLVSNGSASPPSFQALALQSGGVSGVLPVPNGGSGTSALSTAGVVLGNGAGAFSVVPATTAGLFLVSQGSTSAPAWVTSTTILPTVATNSVLWSGGTTAIFTTAPAIGKSLAIGTQTAVPTGGMLVVNANTAALNSTIPSGEAWYLRVGGADGTTAVAVIDSFANFGALTFERANGSGGGPSALHVGDLIGVVDAHGYGATGYSGGAAVALRFNATQTWSDTAQGASFSIWTTPNNTTANAGQRQVALFDQNASATLFGQAIVNLNVVTTLINTGLTGTDLLRVVQADGTACRIEMNSFGVQNFFTAFRADGTAGGMSALVANDIVFSIQAGGYNGLNFPAPGGFQVLAGENWNGTSNGTILRLTTTPNGTTTGINPVSFQNGVAIGTTTDPGLGAIIATGKQAILSNVALASGGTTGNGYSFFSVANLGMYAGTGVPALIAATSALYLRNDAVSSTTRVYVNTNGGSTWVGLTATG